VPCPGSPARAPLSASMPRCSLRQAWRTADQSSWGLSRLVVVDAEWLI
jgi:hypothetical protein